jgi:hypothetical protein
MPKNAQAFLGASLMYPGPAEKGFQRAPENRQTGKKNMKTEKIVILGCFILIGIYVIITAAGYPVIPNTMSSGFFPIVSALFLVCLAVFELILTLLGKAGTSGPVVSGKVFSRILLVTAMLIAMVLIMRYVHSLLGIAVFLLTYLLLIAKVRIRAGALISLAGTAVLYLIIRLLKIPL